MLSYSGVGSPIVAKGGWRKSVTLLATIALALGGGFFGQALGAPQAQAATTGASVGNFWADMNSAGGNYTGWYDAQNYVTQPVSINRNTLYTAGYMYGIGSLPIDGNGAVSSAAVTTFGQPSYGGSATDVPPDPTGCDPAAPECASHTGGAPGRATMPMWLSTLAVDANAAGTRSTAYAYSWTYGTITDASDDFVKVALETSGVTNIPDNMTDGYNTYNPTIQPMFRIADGQTTSQYTAIPLPTYFGETFGNPSTYNYWSGGEVIQQTGDVFLAGAELTCMAAYPMMIFNPNNGDYNFSGTIQPATPSDAIFGSAAATCGYGSGYVASDMALDANGDAYVLATSTVASPTFGVPGGVTTDWLVRIIPGQGGSAWKYELVTPLSNADGNGAPPGPPGSGIFGMAFYNGSLYAASGGGGDLIRINPMSGKIYNVPSGPAASPFVLATPPTNPQNPTSPWVNTANIPTTYDMASGQTSMAIQGTVKDDGTGAPLAGQTVALYMQDPENAGAWTLEGERTTNESGNYVFLAAGNGQYIVRLVNPTSGSGAPAWQTSASVGGKTNVVTALCTTGTIRSTDAVTSGECFGIRPYTYTDPPLPTNPVYGHDTSTIPADMAMYSTVTIATDAEVATASFGVTGIPDPANSTLTLDKSSAQVGTNITATAHMVDLNGNPLPGAVVHFSSVNGKTTITTQHSDQSCTTDTSGNCTATITSSVIGQYPGEIAATVDIEVAELPAPLKNSPQDVEFTPGPPVDGPFSCGDKPGTGIYVTNSSTDPLMSSDTPPVAVQSTSARPGDTVYVTGLVTDGECNPITNAPVKLTFDISQANGAVTVTPDLGVGAAYTPYVLTGTTGADGKVTADLTDTKAGTVTVTGTYDNTKPKPAGDPADTSATMGTGTAAWVVDEVDANASYFTVTPNVASLATTTDWPTVSDGTKADAAHQYTVTVYAKDDADDPLAGQTVTITPAGANASALNLSAVTDNGDGSYTATIWSTVAQSDATISVTVGDDPANIAMQMPKKSGGNTTAALIPFKADVPSTTCTPPAGVSHPWTPGLTANPSTDVLVGNASSTGSTLTATVTDQYCNPISGATVEFSPFTTLAVLSPATGTTDGSGKVSAKLTDVVAETVHPEATVTVDQNGAALSPSIEYSTQVTFIAGPPNSCDGKTPATTCTCLGEYQTPTNLSVGNPSSTSPIPSAMIPGRTMATAHITDQECNVVADGTPVAFSFTNLGGALGSAFTGTANMDRIGPEDSTTLNGDVTLTISDANPEKFDIHATINGGTEIGESPQPFEFTVGDLDSAHSSLSCTSKAADHTNIPIADGVDYYQCVITAQDSAATPNRLANLDGDNFRLTFANQITGVSGLAQPTVPTTVTAPSGVTNTGNGTYTFEVVSTKAGADFTVVADYNGTPVGSPQMKWPVAFKAGPIDMSTTCPVNGANYQVGQVYANPNGQLIGGTSTVVVLLADKECNPIQGADVTFNQNKSATIPGTTTPATTNPTKTNLDGLAMSSVTDNKTEIVTVGGTYNAQAATSGATLADFSDGIHLNDGMGSLTSDTTSMVQFNAGLPSATLSKVSVAPVPQAAGTDVTVTVTVLDDGSNPIDNLTASQVTVTGAYVAGSGTGGTSPTLVVDPNSFTPLGGGKYTYQATSNLVGKFTVTGVAEGVTIAQQPQAEFVAGAVCVDNCTPKNPIAPNGGFTGFVVTLNQQTADGSAADQVTAFAFDTMGNPVGNASVLLNDTTSATGLVGLLTPPAAGADTGTATAGTNGQAVLSFSTNTVGTYTVSGTIGGLVPNANATTFNGASVQSGPGGTLSFVAGQVDAGQSKLIVSPSSQVVGSPISVEVDVNDASGNPVADVAPTAAVYSANETLSGLTQTAPGVWTGTLNSTVAGYYMVSARVPTTSGNLPVGGAGDPTKGAPQNVTFTAGAICIPPACTVTPPTGVDPASVTTRVVVDPNGVMANDTAVDVATVYAFDQYGNPVTGASVATTAVESTLRVVKASGTTDPTTGQTTLTYASTSATTQHANVTIVDPLDATSTPQAMPPSPIGLDFVASAIDPANSTFVVTTAAGAPNAAQAANTPFTLSAHGADTNGNAVEGATISFTAAPGSTLSAATCKTNNKGDCFVTVNSTIAGNYQVGATAPDSSGVTRALGTATGDAAKTSPQQVTWTAGPLCIAPDCTVTPPTGVDPASVTTRVVVDPNGVANDGSTQDVATVFAYDQWGNPVIGAAVASSAAGTNAADLKTQAIINATGANGKTTIGYTSSVAGSYSANVTIFDPSNVTAGPQAVPPTPITLLFGSGLVDKTTSYFTVSPASPLTVGQDAANSYTVMVHANDAMASAVEGAVISFSTAAGPVWSAAPASCTTDVSGVCQLSVHSTLAGTYTITVKAGSTALAPQIAGGDQVAWQSDDVCASNCTPEPGTTKFTTVAVGQNNRTADGSSQDSAIVAAFDKWGNPVSGVTVGVTPDSAMNVVTSLSSQAYTDSTGQMVIYFTSAKAGAHAANFTVEKLGSATQVPTGSPLTLTFVPGAADASASTLELSTHSAAVGDPVTATAQINDKFGNPVGVNTMVTFTLDQSATRIGSTLTTVTVPTDAGGVATLTLTDAKAETGVNVQATLGTTDLGGAGDPAKASPQQVDFTHTPFSAGNSSWTLTASGIMTDGVPSVDGGMYTAILTARDSDNNPIKDLDVSTIEFASSNTDPAAVSIFSPVFNNQDGTYTTIYTSDLADTQPDGTTPIVGVAPLTASVTVDGSAKVAEDPNAATLVTDPSIHFVPGPAIAGPVDCPDPSKTGSSFTVGTNTQVDGESDMLRAHVTDDQCNPVDGVAVTFTTDGHGEILGLASGDGTAGTTPGTLVGTAVTGQTFPTQTATIMTDPGNAWVEMTDYVGPEDTTVHATILAGTPLAPADLKGTNSDGTMSLGSSSPQLVHWTAGTPAINPVCPAVSPYQIGTNISAQSPVTIPATAKVNVLVTDQNCDPLPGVTVNFTITSPTGSVPASALTGDGTSGTTLGVATIPASDTVNEWTTVQATIPSSDQPAAQVINLNPTAGAPARVDPNTGADIDFLAVGTPSVNNPKPGEVIATPTPKIGGTGAVSGDTLVVSDGNGDPIPGCNPVTAISADGSWSCTPTSPIPLNSDGVTASVTATQTDSLGDSISGPTVSFTVNTASPVITSPSNNALTNNTKPTISGTAGQAGSSVTVTDNGTPISGCEDVQVSVTANAAGTYNWICTPRSAMSDGPHVLVPSVKDSEGNQGPTGDSVKVNVDTTPPAAPTAKSDDGSTITGRAEPGSTITVTSDASGKTEPGCVDVLVAADGTFSCTPATKLAAGATVYVWDKDGAGNLSSPTQVTVPLTTALAQVYVQTGGVSASSISLGAGAAAAGGIGLAGVALVIAVIRRREEVSN